MYEENKHKRRKIQDLDCLQDSLNEGRRRCSVILWRLASQVRGDRERCSIFCEQSNEYVREWQWQFMKCEKRRTLIKTREFFSRNKRVEDPSQLQRSFTIAKIEREASKIFCFHSNLYLSFCELLSWEPDVKYIYLTSSCTFPVTLTGHPFMPHYLFKTHWSCLNLRQDFAVSDHGRKVTVSWHWFLRKCHLIPSWMISNVQIMHANSLTSKRVILEIVIILSIEI